MRRIAVTPRADWRETAEQHGFPFHTLDGVPYWDESAAWTFTLAEIEQDLEAPTNELMALCYGVVDRLVADRALMTRIGIPEHVHHLVRRSWQEQERDLYARFDLCYDGTGPAKMLELNGDTPTSLYEAAVFQWLWLEQAMERGIVPAGSDQFNSIHDRLILGLANLGLPGRTLHLGGLLDSPEDRATLDYIADCARQAGLEPVMIAMSDLGIDAAGRFTDTDDAVVQSMFKLYPWEFMVREEFARHLPTSGCRWIEPAWKMCLSNKALLPLLWEAHPGHPNLLESYFADDPKAGRLGDTHVRKPFFSREGANVRIVGPDLPGGGVAVEGPYGAEGHIVQAYSPLPQADGNRAVIGSWFVAGEACGIGIREATDLVTTDTARFVPHIIEG